MVIGFPGTVLQRSRYWLSIDRALRGQDRAAGPEGITALLEPFIDTVIVCSLSSLVVLTTIPRGHDGFRACGDRTHLGGVCLALAWAPYVIAVALLFAFSSALAGHTTASRLDLSVG